LQKQEFAPIASLLGKYLKVLAGIGVSKLTTLHRYIMTDMTLAISDTRPGLAKIFVNDPPMKRMGDRTDLKGAAVYLLSDASAYMTGGELLITGGLHAGLNG
jgi:NAD(P)-dependent dehydrogenase (short-subunit alcohol dehydrogenase family)